MFEGMFFTKDGIYTRLNENGKIIFKKEKKPNILFIEDKNGSFLHLTNGKRYTLKKYKTKKDLERDKILYRHIEYPVQTFLRYKYWKDRTIPDSRVWYLDIEAIDPNNRKFPDITNPDIPITHIQIFDSVENQVYIFTTYLPEHLKEKYKDVQFFVYDDEISMMNGFLSFLLKKKPTIIIAHNGENFDFPYITNRMKVLGFDIDLLSPLKETVCEYIPKQKRWETEWKGLYLVDSIQLLKKFTFTTLKSYSLEYVTYFYLNEGEGKVSYGEYKNIFDFYLQNYDKFIEYAIQDVVSLKKVIENLGLINVLVGMATEMGVNFDKVFGTVAPWSNYLRLNGLKDKFIFTKEEDLPKGFIKGGYVKEPKKGKNTWLFSVDFSSLYPSIIVSYNLSPETYIRYRDLPQELQVLYNRFNQSENEQEAIQIFHKIETVMQKYPDITFAGLGFFRNDFEGILPKLVSKIYYGRKDEKQKMLFADAIASNREGTKLSAKEIINLIESGEINWDNVYSYSVNENDIEELKRYSKLKDIQQWVLKILINSLYGALDNEGFDLNNRDISGSITFMGRFLIQYASKNINKKLQSLFGDDEYVIYNDTDSAYLSIEKFVKKIEQKVQKSYNEMDNQLKRKVIEKILVFIDKYIKPEERATIQEVFSAFNIKYKGFLGFKVEKIIENSIFVAKKRYVLKTIWNEGSFYIEKPKLSITGLDIVRSSTPDYVIEKLEEAVLIAMEDESRIREFIMNVRKEFFELGKSNPEKISKTSSVNNLDYKKDNKGYYRIENEKRIACPINSRASLNYNEFLKEKGLDTTYPLIQVNDKIKYAILKMPNSINDDVIAFFDDTFLKETGLIQYLDLERMFETNFLQPLKLILEAIDFELQEKKSIDF